MKHIGFIMDGNRRWAKKIGNLVSFGHSKGGDNVENVLKMCLDAGIKYTSMWALSSENLTSRSEKELADIFDLFRKKVPPLIEKLKSHKINLKVVGDLWLLPVDVREILLNAIDETVDGDAMTFILAIAYGGQDEIIRGIRRFVAEGQKIEDLNEKNFLEYLDTGTFPPPDLIVRTGGYERHSGYFLYQSAYSEYFFTDTLWPDFSADDFQAALDSYNKTKRNFGK